MTLIGDGELMVGADHRGYGPELDADPAEQVAV
jgi:hypothetical protein